MGKLDEDWVSGAIVNHTSLTGANISKCRAFDTRFPFKMWQVMMNTTLNAKLPPECKAKPVMALLTEKKIKAFGDIFRDLAVDDDRVFSTGIINWGNICLFRGIHVVGSDFLQAVQHIDTDIEVDIAEEEITNEFDIENNFNVNTAAFVRGSRTHSIINMFKDKHEQARMQQWQGKQQIDSVTTNARVDESHSALMAKSQAKKLAGMPAARARLEEFKEETKKRRRVTVADAE